MVMMMTRFRAPGLRVLLNPAPMLREVIRKVPIELLSMLVLNETEAQSFAEAVMDEGRMYVVGGVIREWDVCSS